MPEQGSPVDWHTLEGHHALEQLGGSEQGLTGAEAARRLQQCGPNALPPAPPEPAWRRFARQFQNTLIYVLIASGVISLLMGHRVDAGVIFGVVLINALVGFVQEGKASAALQTILGMTRTRSLVWRDGQLRTVDSSELVPGDVVSLQAGDKVPADLRLLQLKDLACDESMLTGESVAVRKHLEADAADVPLAEQYGMAFMGTLVTAGVARGLVCRTAAQTEIGRISELTRQVSLTATPLQVQLTRFARQLSILTVVIALLTLLIGNLLRGLALDDMVQAAIGIAVATIPEGLPAIVTIALAIGVQRMARQQALVRRLPSVEVLGSVDVICSDKTGTLTANAMTARQCVTALQLHRIGGDGYSPQGAIEPAADGALLAAARVALLCNDASVSQEDGQWRLHGDPTEGALLVLARKALTNASELLEHWPRVEELPFESERRYMATLHRSDTDGVALLAVKGAPDRLIGCCDSQFGSNGPEPLELSRWQAELQRLGADGMRVMALAERRLPVDSHAEHALVEQGLCLLALVGISDPPRPEAIASIARCHQAGIRVKMITGDNPVTAAAIGAELGLNVQRVMTGAELDRLDSKGLDEAASAVDIFARTSPANKLQLVEALQRQGRVVAMTGDGVNDAPALRQANIGIAMGGKGTDAAREAGDMVLTDDNFATIAHAVAEGRTVYDNVVKSILYILPTSLAEATVIILAILLGWTLPITPAQILWINMVTTVTLALALAFEPPEPGVMARPPRPAGQSLIGAALAGRAALVSVWAALLVFWQFSDYLSHGASVELARAVAVNTLVMIEAVYLINCRFLDASVLSPAIVRRAGPMLGAIVGVVLLQLLYSYLPWSQQLFGLESLSAADWLRLTAVALSIFVVVELEKALRRWQAARHSARQ
ncbi:MAG: HAD-IC family P-type ATPase [Pseudomonas sp.]|uniref:cation-translocating P-type ATPase n=1 Tax=Pseudomonas sp. TaxID=306 RepID=UPI0032423FE9